MSSTVMRSRLGGSWAFAERVHAVDSAGSQILGLMRLPQDKPVSRVLQLEGMAKMSHVILHTPMSEELSGALVCFDVEGMTQKEVVAALAKKNIVATTTPCRVSYARLTPGIMNSEEEIETTLRAVNDLKA